MSYNIKSVNLCSNLSCKRILRDLHINYCNEICQKLHNYYHQVLSKGLFELITKNNDSIVIPLYIITYSYRKINDIDNKNKAVLWDTIDNKTLVLDNRIPNFNWNIINKHNDRFIENMKLCKRILVIKRLYEKKIQFLVKIVCICKELIDRCPLEKVLRTDLEYIKSSL